jgi:hypothetical protein
MMLRCGIILVLLLLAGCADNRARQEAPPQLPTINIPAGISKDDVAGAVRTEVNQSSDAIQQNTQALLGASIGKIAEKVDAALAKVEANLNARVDLQSNATASLLADLKAELNLSAQINSQAIAMAQLEARIDAKLEAFMVAQGAAVAGIGNKVSESVQKLSAGRDNNNTQFTTEMAEVFERAFSSVTTTVYIMAGALTSILGGATFVMNRGKEASRQRAEERAKEYHNVILQKVKNV